MSNNQKHPCGEEECCGGNCHDGCCEIPPEVELENIRKDYEELKELLQRTHADFQNFRRRIDEEKKSFITLSNEQLIYKLLPILDNFELAMKSKNTPEFIQGIEMIQEQLRQTLQEEGLAAIPAAGKFDPKLHEAIQTTESEKEPGTILEEAQKGYMLGNKVLRHSKVKISKKGDANE